MLVIGTGSKACLLSTALLFTTTAIGFAADHGSNRVVHNPGQPAHQTVSQQHPVDSRLGPTIRYGADVRHAIFTQAILPHGRKGGPNTAVSHPGGISCVPYARQVSGIKVVGNAWQWWEHAAGVYARGDRPEAGSVLNFRSNGRMPLGHVAVVTRVVNAREIVVDQANWASNGLRGAISHDVAVVDVSEANNWSAVRVELGRKGQFGSVYPTYGFIYNRADTGFVTASVNRPAPQPQINPVPSDLRPVAERPWHAFEEVAQSPLTPSHRIDLRAPAAAARY